MSTSVQRAGLVSGLELRTRLRGRWRIILVLWMLLLLGMAALFVWAYAGTRYVYTDNGDQLVDPRPTGGLAFGWLVYVLLGLGLLVAPAYTAASINGERERGTLAVIQSTLLRPWDLVLGKFLAGAGSVLALMVLALPAALLCWSRGGFTLLQGFVQLLAITVMLTCVVAVGLAASAILMRPVLSSLVTYAVVAILGIGTLVAFTGGLAATSETVTQTYERQVWLDDNGNEYYPEDPSTAPPPAVVKESYPVTRARPDKVWFLLAPNPFVILADLSPRQGPLVIDGKTYPTNEELADTLARSIQELRIPPQEPTTEAVFAPSVERGPLVWPFGVGFLVALAGLGLFFASRRLRTPYRRLARGQRIA